ncbi:MAG: response regulator transcription factor [Anaerolineales bacterium]
MTRVLIVDDQPLFRRHLHRLLVHAGLEFAGEARDVQEAAGLLEMLRPDLVVMDVMLPGVNGLEGTRRLKRLAPALRVILLSAYRDSADVFRAAAREVGAEAFLSKDELDLKVVQAWEAR